MTIMNKNLNTKLEELHGFQPLDTSVALTEIRSQLHELTKSVESCQSEVFDVKTDMMTIKSEIDSVQFVKEEIDDIRDSLFRLEADGERRKARLLDQGLTFLLGDSIFAAVLWKTSFNLPLNFALGSLLNTSDPAGFGVLVRPMVAASTSIAEPADVFSFGISLFAILTCKKPYANIFDNIPNQFLQMSTKKDSDEPILVRRVAFSNV